MSVEKQTIFKEESAATAEAASTAETAEMKPTSVGVEENIAALLCHIPIIGLIFFFIEKENKVVRFHALQVIMLSIVLFVAAIAVAIISVDVISRETWLVGLDNKWTFLLLNHASKFHLISYSWHFRLTREKLSSSRLLASLQKNIQCRNRFNSKTNMKLSNTYNRFETV